MSEQTNKQINV